MTDLFNTGIRPLIDAHIEAEAAKERDYGLYWSASSAGYCMRLTMMRRLGVPPIPEIAEDKARTQRVFSSGHIFHEWIQGLTKEAGLSIAQELQLQDEELMIRGHIDDLIHITYSAERVDNPSDSTIPDDYLILYDYKTVHSDSFNYKKDKIGHYHKMQLGTYMYMLRELQTHTEQHADISYDLHKLGLVTEARRLSISKDDLRMAEVQLLWSPHLEKEVYTYWSTLNGYWRDKKLPKCTCLEIDGGYMGRRSKKGKIYNDYMYNEIPCNIEWFNKWKKEGASAGH